MTVDLSVHIDYEAVFSAETVKRVLEAIQSTIAANWFSARDPRDPVSLGLNLGDTELLAQQIVQQLAEAKRSGGQGSYFAIFRVAFSPRAPISLCVRVRLHEERTIGVVLSLETDMPMHVDGTWTFPQNVPEWLANLERWSAVSLVPGLFCETARLDSMKPDARAAWFQAQDQLPLSESLWLTYEQELRPIVAALAEALPVEANQDLNVFLDCGKADVKSVVQLTMTALHAVVVENWRALSALPPGFWPEFIEELGAAEIERKIADFEHSDQTSDSVIAYFPDCCHQLYYDFSRDSNGVVTVKLSIPATALEEVEGSVERGKMVGEWFQDRTSFHRTLPSSEDMQPDELKAWQERYIRLGQTPSTWPKSRKHFLAAIERVKLVLPVEKFEMDPRLT